MPGISRCSHTLPFSPSCHSFVHPYLSAMSAQRRALASMHAWVQTAPLDIPPSCSMLMVELLDA